MFDFEKAKAQYSQAWNDRNYRLDVDADGLPEVVGDTGQFYCDAVANDCGAAFLMEHLRKQNPDEYARYREDARDDTINLDKSQDQYVYGISTYA